MLFVYKASLKMAAVLADYITVEQQTVVCFVVKRQ
jgi:hypothetical protein